MLSRENLMGMSSWGGFCGIMFIILGALGAITGVFAFVVGAIPGILMILMGAKLMSAKNQLQLLLTQPPGMDTTATLNEIFSNLKQYLMFQGILFILYLVFIAIAIIVMLVAGIGTLSILQDL
ncbi:MAG TPA: DUF5362 family protein [Syntrophomonas sp.]|nr:DUF5362 family protein [Syntrophomonas sp.]